MRARRRYRELTEKGIACDLKEIEQDILDRDHRDMHREHSPLVQAEDAVYLDSSDMTLDQVVDAIGRLIDQKIDGQAGEGHECDRCKDRRVLLCSKKGCGEGLRTDQKTDKPIYTYGPIIHNEEVVKDLKKRAWRSSAQKRSWIASGTVWWSSVPMA